MVLGTINLFIGCSEPLQSSDVPNKLKQRQHALNLNWIVTKNVSVRTYLKKRPRLRHPRFFLPGPFFSTRWAGHKNISTSTQAGTRVTRWDLTKPAPNSPTDGR